MATLIRVRFRERINLQSGSALHRNFPAQRAWRERTVDVTIDDGDLDDWMDADAELVARANCSSGADAFSFGGWEIL